MKLKGLSLILPLADVRPLCAPATRLHFLSPFAAKPESTYLKGFGLAGQRKLRIPWRPHETIFFHCSRGISLPASLPDGTGVTRAVRRVYLDPGATVRFDLSIFSNPRHQIPASSGTVNDWIRKFWDTPLGLREHGQTQSLPCPLIFKPLTEKLIKASTLGQQINYHLVDPLSPLLIALVQEKPKELPSSFRPLDTDGTLFAEVRPLSLPRFAPSVTAVCIAHIPGHYLRPRDSEFNRLRMARLLPAWLHTDIQVLLSLTRRLHADSADLDLVIPYVEEVAESLASVSAAASNAGLSIGVLSDLYENGTALLAESLKDLDRSDAARKVTLALPSQAAASKAGTAHRFAPQMPRREPSTEGPGTSLDAKLDEVLKAYSQKLLTGGEHGGTRYDDADFRESAVRKARGVFKRLPPGLLRQPPVILSVGGADGTELFELMEQTQSVTGVLLEYSDRSTERARLEASRRGVDLKILTGDAMQKLPDAMAAAKSVARPAGEAPVLVTMMAILHELPSRSPSFDLLRFLALLGDASVIIGREPVEPSNWTEQVILSGAFDAAKFATVSNDVVLGRYLQLHRSASGVGVVERVADHTVRGHRGLVLETLVKAFYAEDLEYELGECFTGLQEEIILRYLKLCFRDSHWTSCHPVTSDSISRYWQKYALRVEAVDSGRPLGKPASHLWYEVIRLDLIRN